MEAIRCDGTPVWRGTFVASGNGTYTTAPVRLDRAGYYTYRESIVEGLANPAVTTDCGDVAETTLARAEPQVTTLASAEVVVCRGRCCTTAFGVCGLGRTSGGDRVEHLRALRLARSDPMHGRAVLEGALHGRGGRRPSFRPWFGSRRRVSTRTGSGIFGSALIEGTRGECGATAETSLSRPLIVTGGRSATRGRALGRGRRRPDAGAGPNLDARDRRAADALGP